MPLFGPAGGAGGAIATQSAQLLADVSVPAATWTSIVSLSLAAGTWVVLGTVDGSSASAGTNMVARLWDGTTVYASAEGNFSSAGNPVTLPLVSRPIVLAATTTVSLHVWAGAGCTVAALSGTGGTALPGVTALCALKVA